MVAWDIPAKPAELTEKRIVEAILDGTFPVNSSLPPERELAEKLGVTRPTLREALQRLSRDGWIEIHHGRSTRVKDYYWQEGNLLILTAIAQHEDKVPKNFVPNLLQVRVLMAPTYTRMAMQNSLNEVIHLFESLQNIEDTEEFTKRDLDMHKQLTILSRNPVFTLILNGFGDLYQKMGLIYFNNTQSRDHSRSFYKKMLSAVLSNDFYLAEEVTRQVMEDSIELMNKAVS